MPIPAASTLHAHFAPLPSVESVRSRFGGRGETRWTMRSHGQECNLQHDSNRTVHHQSHLGTRIQFVDSKQATPTAFDPCRPAGVPTTTAAIHAIDAVVSDELTPSKLVFIGCAPDYDMAGASILLACSIWAAT
jgi:hypothetical protein